MKVPTAAVEWVMGPDTGLPALTICAVMAGVAGTTLPAVPADVTEYARCHRLLTAVPEWRRRLREVAEAHPEWAGLVDEWDRIERLYTAEGVPASYGQTRGGWPMMWRTTAAIREAVRRGRQEGAQAR